MICKRLLFLAIILSSFTCNNNLLDKLRNGWICIEDMDCPDFIYFHKSGRYVILNDCGSEHPWIPIVERGNWEIKNRDIILKNREFVSTFSGFRKYYGSDSLLLLSIKYISNKELTLDFKRDGIEYTDHYKRQKRSSVMMQRFFDRGSSIKTLSKPTYRGLLLLKLEYKLFYPGAHESTLSELTVEDQDGHELWKKTIIFKHKKETEEVFLADRPEIINLSELVFKVKTQQNVTWELKAKFY